MGVWSKILGKDNIVKKAADGLYNGLDAAFYTDEEKQDNFKSIIKLYEPFKLIQRVIARYVTVAFLSVWAICTLMFSASIFADPCMVSEVCKAMQLKDTAIELAELNIRMLGTPFLAINSLYFGGGFLEGGIKAYKDK